MKFGLDRLLTNPALSAPLKGRRVGLVAAAIGTVAPVATTTAS